MSSGATSWTLRAKNSRSSTVKTAARPRAGLALASRSLRARRPRSPRSTLPFSASWAIRSANASASSSRREPAARSCAHVVEDRPLRPRGDDRRRDAVHPDLRAASSSPVLAPDRLERVDLVGARVLAEPEEDHAGRGVGHALIIARASPLSQWGTAAPRSTSTARRSTPRRSWPPPPAASGACGAPPSRPLGRFELSGVSRAPVRATRRPAPGPRPAGARGTGARASARSRPRRPGASPRGSRSARGRTAAGGSRAGTACAATPASPSRAITPLRSTPRASLTT